MAKKKGKWTKDEIRKVANELFLDDYKSGHPSDLDDLKGCFEDGTWDMTEAEFKQLCDLYFEMWA